MTTVSYGEAPLRAEINDRAALFLHQAAQAARHWYDGEGNWLGLTCPPETRERYWISLALYGHGEAARADAVLRRGETRRSHIGVDGDSSFDIFHTNIACVLLLKHGPRMADDVRHRLEALVREGLGFDPGNRRPDYQFHGYNDNMPAKATMGLVLGGEMFGCREAVEHGLWNLRQLRSMLVRRGTHSEWNSPTYSPITIHALGEIAEHADDAGARELARALEERLWIDVAARFHPGIGTVAGPYSRAYTVDTVAHHSSLASLLWFILGDAARPSPMDLFAHDSGLVLHHMGDRPFNVAQMCWLAAGVYHVPAQASRLFARKTYPFRAVATAEQGDCGPDNPAAANRIETFLEPDFAVGTSHIPFLMGQQAVPYFVLYKRAEPIRSCRDIGTIFHKFTIDDEAPGAIRTPRAPDGTPYANSGEGDNVDSHCGWIALQAEAAVLALSHPRLSLGGLEEIQPARAVRRLSEMIVFPSHFADAEEVRIGSRRVESWSGEAKHGEWIGCRRGRLLVAIRTLAYTRDLGPVRTVLERVRPYDVIRTTFYQGPARFFSRSELRNVYGGFVAEHAGTDDYPSLAAFLEELSGSAFTDCFLTTRRVRYQRPGGRGRCPLEMEVSWSPGSLLPRHATINGVPPSEDRIHIDGVDPDELPFLAEPPSSVPVSLPWESVDVPLWGIRGAVSDRGC